MLSLARRTARMLWWLCLVSLCTAVCGAQDTVYVSPAGNDIWSGKLATPNASASDGPLKTLDSVRDHVRQLRQQQHAGEIHVILRGGTYSLSKPFELGPEDSGLPNGQTIYEAYPNESPVLSGGVPISDWKQSSKEVWSGSPGFATTQLFWNGARAHGEQSH